MERGEELALGIEREPGTTVGEEAATTSGLAGVRCQKTDLGRVKVGGIQTNAGRHHVEGIQADGGTDESEVDAVSEVNVTLGFRSPRHITFPEGRQQTLQGEP